MTRVAINGFGRIGRVAFRALLKRDNIQVVAINDLQDPGTLHHLMKYDTSYGPIQAETSLGDGEITVNGSGIKLYAERNPADLPWAELNVDVVLDCTGLFKTYDKAEAHLKAGAKRVLLSYPVKDPKIKSVVLGVNGDGITADDLIISNASCTTNCTAPLVKVLEDNWGIESGFLSTIHAYTGDQRIIDTAHGDLRRARAGAANIIPTSTGAASALGIIFPQLAGKIHGGAYRVPVLTGSVIELQVKLSKDFTVDAVNAAIKAAADSDLKGVVEYTEDPIVSSDIVANTHSSIFDSLLTDSNDGILKVVSWYDNENGYSNRMVDLTVQVAGLI